MNIKLFTHIADFDGVACAVLAKLVYGSENVDVTYANYDNIDELVIKYADFAKTNDYHNLVYITDLSIKPETAEYLESIQPDYYSNGFMITEKFQLIDHHQSALYLKDKFWAIVETHDGKGKQLSATELFHYYFRLNNENPDLDSNNIKRMVSIVTELDTWAWKKNNNPEPMKWGRLMKLYGAEKFEEIILDRLDRYYFELLDEENLILNILEEKDNRYMNDVLNKGIIEGEIGNFKYGLVYADSCISELGNKICELGYEVGIVVSFTWRTIGFRSIKENVDVSKIVKLISNNSGGHVHAGGLQLGEPYLEFLATQLIAER